VSKGWVLNIIQLWFTGYVSPAKLVDELRSKPAPLWGFYAQLLRASLDALLLYLPLFLLGREPPTRSYLTFVPTQDYYRALVLLAPVVLTAQWLLGGALMHVVLRLWGRKSDIDQILNISGMATLVIGAFLVVWDWVWIFLGGMNQNLLGTSHLLIDVWWVVIMVVGLKRILGVPVRSGILLSLLVIAVSLPLAVMFMRSPL
jgi:hypothetical protein